MHVNLTSQLYMAVLTSGENIIFPFTFWKMGSRLSKESKVFEIFSSATYNCVSVFRMKPAVKLIT